MGAHVNTMVKFIKTVRISVLVASTSAPASMERWDVCPSAPAICPWRHLPVLLHNWSRCQASAALALTATREPPSCLQCTADPNPQPTSPIPSFPIRPTPTQSHIQNHTGSCTHTSTKRRRTPWATSWWNWGANGTNCVETSTWRVREGGVVWPTQGCFLFAVKHHVYAVVS